MRRTQNPNLEILEAAVTVILGHPRNNAIALAHDGRSQGSFGTARHCGQSFQSAKRPDSGIGLRGQPEFFSRLVEAAVVCPESGIRRKCGGGQKVGVYETNASAHKTV